MASTSNTDPAFNYYIPGRSYSRQQRTDPHIAAYIHTAAGTAKTILHVRADSGAWDRKFGHFRSQPNFMGDLHLLVAYP